MTTTPPAWYGLRFFDTIGEAEAAWNAPLKWELRSEGRSDERWIGRDNDGWAVALVFANRSPKQ